MRRHQALPLAPVSEYLMLPSLYYSTYGIVTLKAVWSVVLEAFTIADIVIP
jgi:hypothetical protein